MCQQYFPAINRKNVSLETGNIDKFTANGIQVDGTESEYDLIILATGFRTVEFMYPIKITGTNGRSISDIWHNGARALYGVTVESCPNFAMAYGPNSNLGHNSIILMIEAQSRYINALIGEVLKARTSGRSLTISPHLKRVDEFNDEIQALLNASSFAHPNCTSWYKNESGRITNNWSGTVVDYQKLLSNVRWDDFERLGSGADEIGSSTKTIGRVREETLVSYQTLGLSALSMLAVAGGVVWKSGRLRLR